VLKSSFLKCGPNLLADGECGRLGRLRAVRWRDSPCCQRRTPCSCPRGRRRPLGGLRQQARLSPRVCCQARGEHLLEASHCVGSMQGEAAANTTVRLVMLSTAVWDCSIQVTSVPTCGLQRDAGSGRGAVHPPGRRASRVCSGRQRRNRSGSLRFRRVQRQHGAAGRSSSAAGAHWLACFAVQAAVLLRRCARWLMICYFLA